MEKTSHWILTRVPLHLQVFPLNPAQPSQLFEEGAVVAIGGPLHVLKRLREADDRQSALILLCSDRQRPRRRSAHKCEQASPPHSIPRYRTGLSPKPYGVAADLLVRSYRSLCQRITVRCGKPARSKPTGFLGGPCSRIRTSTGASS